jgi:Mrp family chromosome partitioning ATPase
VFKSVIILYILPIINMLMTQDSIFITSTIHLFHRYKGVVIVFLCMALAGVTAHHFLFPNFLSTATLRVDPSAGTVLTGKSGGAMFGNMNTEADYVKYVKFMKSRNFHFYIDKQLAANSKMLARVQKIYGDKHIRDMNVYTEMLFDDIDYSGREGDLIDITASKSTASDAVDLSNLMAEIARQYLVENEMTDIDDTINYLNDETLQQQRKLDSLNKEAETMQKNNEIAAGPAQSSTELSLISLRQDLNLARVKLTENGYLALDILRQIKGTTHLQTSGEVVNDDSMRGRLIDKLRDLKDEDNAFKAKIRALEEQIAVLKTRLDPRSELKASSLQKRLTLEEEIFFSLKKRAFDIQLYKVSLGSHVRLHSTAVIPLVVRKLSLGKKLLLTLILALLAVSVFVLFREQVNPTVCHGLHLKAAGIGFLASIPYLNAVKGLLSKLKGQDEGSRSILIDNFSVKTKRTMPFQFIRLKILHLFKEKPGPLVISLLSCSTREGKSVVAANLAACFDFYQMKTILVDCDPVHAGQQDFFNSAAAGGLTEALADEVEVPFVIQKTEMGHLDFIAAGKERDFGPGEFEARITKVLHSLKQKYDVVILDCPNFFSCDNAITLSRKSEMVVVVADAFHTRVSQLNNVVNTLHLSEVENIYGVINRAEDYFGLNNALLDSISAEKAEVRSIRKGA